MNWTDRERRAVVNSVMNIGFQNFGEFLDCLRTCWFLQTHCAAVHCINRTVQTVRRQKSVPCRTDRSSPSVTGSPALFLQSTIRSPVRSVTSHQTDDAVSVTFLQTSTFFSTPKPRSYFAGLSLQGLPFDPSRFM
jgi:hypothetical protein